MFLSADFFRYVRVRHQQKSSDEFLLANRSMEVSETAKWNSMTFNDLFHKLPINRSGRWPFH